VSTTVYSVERYESLQAFSDGSWGTQSQLVLVHEKLRTREEAALLAGPGDRIGETTYPYYVDFWS
tara:strand:+ start:10567 stop:10761 length:195 start_codon:yes stop_codon:yes gene_type:complete